MAGIMIDRATHTAELLQRHPIADLRRLEIMEDDGEVVIEGIVPSYYLKQMAQEAVRPALGGRRLRNHVLVLAPK